MKLRLLAGVLVLALSPVPSMAQVNPGTSPLSGAKGGTNNAFMQFTGPASSMKTFTLPNASGTIDLLNAVQTFTAAKTFADATLLLAGSSSGATTLKAQAAASGTLSLPAATDTLVARATTDTLANKTIDTAGPNTIKINGNTLSASAGTATVTVPNATDTLVGRATTDTLTNKTLTNPAFTVGAPTAAATMGFNAAGGPPNYGDGSANHVIAALDLNQTFSGNNTFSGRGIFTGTSAPASAAGNTVVLGTLASPPTLSNNGQGFHFNTASGGAVVQGAGSTYDVILMNKSGTAVAAVATGSTTFELAGGLKLSALGTGSCANGGLSLDGSNNTVKTGCPAILIGSGTAALGTAAISSAACASVVTVSATGVATTDVVTASFNSDPTAVTGYIPSTAGMLTIFAYPTANNVNFKVCNNTLASITPGAVTLNWRVVR